MIRIDPEKLSLFFVLTLFLQRPAALGQNFTAHGLLLLVFLTCIYILLKHAKIHANPSAKRDIIFVVMLIIVYLIYESATAIIFGKSNVMSWSKELIITTVVVSCYAIFLLDRPNNIKFFQQFTSVVSMLGWSSAITLMGAWAIGLDSLKLFRIEIKLYEDFGGGLSAGTIYFPFSMAYSSLKEMDIFSLYRFSGFFREAGIYQAIAAYCLSLALLNKRSYWVVCGLVLGIICTFSTAGLAMMAVAIGSALWLRGGFNLNKLIATGMILLTGGYIALFAPLIGLEAKREDTAFSASVNDRSGALNRGLERASVNPFGDGPFSGTVANDQITLISSLGSIGVIGFLLQVILISGLRPSSRFELSARMAACLPILLTALFSQPIHGLPLIYVLLMVRPEIDNKGVHHNWFGTHKKLSLLHGHGVNSSNYETSSGCKE